MTNSLPLSCRELYLNLFLENTKRINIVRVTEAAVFVCLIFHTTVTAILSANAVKYVKKLALDTPYAIFF